MTLIIIIKSLSSAVNYQIPNATNDNIYTSYLINKLMRNSYFEGEINGNPY